MKNFLNYIYLLIVNIRKSLILKTIYLKFVEASIIFFISLILIRLLGPSDYGKLNYVFSYVFLLRPLYIFGMPSVLQAQLSRDKNSFVIINRLLTIQIGLFLLISIFSFFILKNIFNTEYLKLFIILQLGFGFRIFDLFTQSLFVFNKGIESGKITTLSAIKLLIFLTLACIFYLDLSSIAFAYLINYITDLIIIFFILNKNNFSHLLYKFKLDFNDLIKNIKKSLPLAASSFISMFLMKSDVILITYFMGNFSAGIYSAPALLVLKINVFLNLISLNLIPKLNHKLKKNIDKNTNKLFVSTWLFSFVAAALFYILGPYIFRIGFGEEYIDSLKLIPLLSINIFFNGILITSNAFLNFYNFEKIIFYKSLITLLINFLLNILLIPSFGLKGVLFALLVSTIFNAFSGFLLNQKLRIYGKSLLLPDFKYLLL